jgi:hypothetical protein
MPPKADKVPKPKIADITWGEDDDRLDDARLGIPYGM